MQVPAGSPIPISLQLWDGNTEAFVKAFLVNEDGSPYSPSSVNLRSVGNGLYLNTSLNMPSSGVIFASLFVYVDDLYTIQDENYTATSDDFTVAQSGGGGGGGGSGTTNQSIIGFVVNGNPVTGLVQNSSVTGIVQNPSSVSGEVQGSNVVGEIENNETVIGDING